ncbi:Peptide chain release factor 1 [Streptomyces antimycoticus]
MFEAVEELIGEHADLEKRLADPAVHADQREARRLNKRYAELTPVIAAYRAWKQVGEDIETARELAQDDPDFVDEVKELELSREELTDRLRLLLVPRDPSDDKDVILEVKAGEGGEESALFAGDLLRMYLRYAERVGWKTEILDANESDLGGQAWDSGRGEHRRRADPGAVRSSIVDVTGKVPVLLRAGALTAEQLREVVPDLEVAN